MKLIVGEEEIPVLTAMEEYIDDVIIAIDHPVVFDADFRDRTADNTVSFGTFHKMTYGDTDKIQILHMKSLI